MNESGLCLLQLLHHRNIEFLSLEGFEPVQSYARFLKCRIFPNYLLEIRSACVEASPIMHIEVAFIWHEVSLENRRPIIEHHQTFFFNSRHVIIDCAEFKIKLDLLAAVALKNHKRIFQKFKGKVCKIVSEIHSSRDENMASFELICVLN